MGMVRLSWFNSELVVSEELLLGTEIPGSGGRRETHWELSASSITLVQCTAANREHQMTQ